MSRQAERKRAIELKAADVREVLEKMPPVLRALKPEQIDQVQRFLDAQVLNPVIEKEFKELDRKSIIAESNGYTNRNPAIVAQRDKKSEEYIRLGDSDKRIRLDVDKLLTQDAFTPESDNPDEAYYHLRVRNTLAASGVWLRLDRRNPTAYGQPGSLPVNDPKRYSFALSVGSDGSLIPTMSGLLTREVLVRTSLFADHYSQHVIKGPTRKLLDRAIDKLQIELAHGWGDHLQYVGADGKGDHSLARRTAEGIAGVDLPDIRMWDVARSNLHLANESIIKGRFLAAHQYVQVAALMIVIADQAIAHYMKVTSKAASQVLTVLKVADKAGDIAEALMIVRAVGMRLLRLVRVNGTALLAEGGAGAGAGASGTGRPLAPTVPEVPLKGQSPYRPPAPTPGGMARSPVNTQQGKYPTNYHGHEAYDHTLRERQAYEIAVQRGNRTAGATVEATSPTGGAQSGGNFALNRQELSYMQRLDAWNKEYFKEMSDYMRRHPRLPSYTPQMELIMQRLDKKWGVLID